MARPDTTLLFQAQANTAPDWVFTVPAGKKVELHILTVTNSDSAERTVTFYAVPGQPPQEDPGKEHQVIFASTPVDAASTGNGRVEWFAEAGVTTHVFPEGYTFWIQADAAAVVTFLASGSMRDA